MQAEGGPAGNPLNIGPGRNYGTSAAAAAAAAALVNSSHYYTGIRQAIQSHNAGMEVAAIKASPWDAGHYSNGVLDRTFAAATGGRVPTTAGGAAAGAALPAAAPGLSARQAFALNNMNQLLGLDMMPTFHASTGALPSSPQTPFAGNVTATLGGGYVHPLPGAQLGRVDQGQDFHGTPGASVLAIGSGRVDYIKPDPSGFGQALYYTLASGPLRGQQVYVGHAGPTVRPGQIIQAGQPVAQLLQHPGGNATVPGWAEIGFSSGGAPTGNGQAFADFLHRKRRA